MWYPLKTFEQENFFYNQSNDSRLIENYNFYEAHSNQYEAYNDIISSVDIMISHIPLIEIDSHHKYKRTECYLTPVRDLAPVTIQGHCHEQKTYHKADKTILMNAVGYDDQDGRIELTYYEYEKDES